jgi:hypothetical protein
VFKVSRHEIRGLFSTILSAGEDKFFYFFLDSTIPARSASVLHSDPKNALQPIIIIGIWAVVEFFLNRPGCICTFHVGKIEIQQN